MCWQRAVWALPWSNRPFASVTFTGLYWDSANGRVRATVVARWDTDHTPFSLPPRRLSSTLLTAVILGSDHSHQHPISSRQRTLKTLTGHPAVEIQTNKGLSSLFCSIPLSLTSLTQLTHLCLSRSSPRHTHTHTHTSALEGSAVAVVGFSPTRWRMYI